MFNTSKNFSMDLSQAYGPAFFAPALGVSDESKNYAEQAETVRESTETNHHQLAETTPNVYLIEIKIDRDDCHLLCMFIGVLILSLLFSSRK